MVIAILVACAACGDDDVDLSGIYAVTHHTENSGDCVAEGNDVDDPPFFSMDPGELFGVDIFAYSECTSADPISCQAGGLFFQLPIDGGWRNEQSGIIGGGNCVLSFQEATAVFEPSGDLRIESRRYEEAAEFPFSDPRCTTDEAELRGDTMPCAEFLVITGTPVTG